MDPKTAEKIQSEIYRKMSPQRKIAIASQLILLAKKLKAAKIIKTNK